MFHFILQVFPPWAAFNVKHLGRKCSSKSMMPQHFISLITFQTFCDEQHEFLDSTEKNKHRCNFFCFCLVFFVCFCLVLLFLAEARLWELHPCSISGLWAVVCPVCVSSVCFFLPSDSSFLTVASSQVLLRTSCCLLCSFLSCWRLLQPPLPVSLSWLCIAVVFHFFWGDPLSSSSICWLAFTFWLSDTHPPPPLPAVRSPMVQCCACLHFCGWSVGLSPVRVKLCQLVLCCGLSSEWTMCIRLHSFPVRHRPIPTSRMLHVLLRSCCCEITSLQDRFHCVGRFSLTTRWNRARWWQWGRNESGQGDAPWLCSCQLSYVESGGRDALETLSLMQELSF